MGVRLADHPGKIKAASTSQPYETKGTKKEKKKSKEKESLKKRL